MNAIPPKDYRPNGANGDALKQQQAAQNALPEAHRIVDEQHPILKENLDAVIAELKGLEDKALMGKHKLKTLVELQSDAEKAGKVAKWLTEIRNGFVTTEVQRIMKENASTAKIIQAN